MASKTNRKCVICGKKYYYCPECEEFRDKPHWMAAWCGNRCHETYEILVDYGTQKIDKSTAYKKIKTFDWSDIDSWENPVTQRDIKEILSYVDKKASQPVKAVVAKADSKDAKETKKFWKNKV